jgi:single-stranded DNA-specific DHH superfamily exonuclease
MLNKFLSLIEGKNVFLATHWDADGVSSGAMIYHTIQNKANSVKTISKGTVFRIDKEDVPEGSEIVICTDIQPSKEIEQPVIYIDHHPLEEGAMEECLFSVHDVDAQSCALLIWEKLLKQTDEPYFLFLTLLGFFGDGGKNAEIPIELEVKAMDAFPHLMKPNMSYDGRTYLDIERHVSALNTGKRLHWQGTVPFELLKSIDSYEPFVNKTHPLASEIERYKRQLRKLYSMEINLINVGSIQFAKIDCDKNIQGVLCARHMNGKPILVLNNYDGDNMMASMRVPDHLDFDAGTFLQKFVGKVPGLHGGGHEKAGGVSFPAEHYSRFMNLLETDGN